MDFRDADFRLIDSGDTDLRDAGVRGADSRDADVRDTGSRDSDFRDTDFRDAGFWDGDFRDSDFRDVDFRRRVRRFWCRIPFAPQAAWEPMLPRPGTLGQIVSGDVW